MRSKDTTRPSNQRREPRLFPKHPACSLQTAGSSLSLLSVIPLNQLGTKTRAIVDVTTRPLQLQISWWQQEEHSHHLLTPPQPVRRREERSLFLHTPHSLLSADPPPPQSHPNDPPSSPPHRMAGDGATIKSRIRNLLLRSPSAKQRKSRESLGRQVPAGIHRGCCTLIINPNVTRKRPKMRYLLRDQHAKLHSRRAS